MSDIEVLITLTILISTGVLLGGFGIYYIIKIIKEEGFTTDNLILIPAGIMMFSVCVIMLYMFIMGWFVY